MGLVKLKEHDIRNEYKDFAGVLPNKTALHIEGSFVRNKK